MELRRCEGHRSVGGREACDTKSFVFHPWIQGYDVSTDYTSEGRLLSDRNAEFREETRLFLDGVKRAKALWRS